MHELILAIAAVAYLGATLLLYLSISRSSRDLRKISVLIAGAGLLIHAIGQYQHWFSVRPVGVSVLDILSLCALVIVALLLTSLLSRKPLYDAGLVALPIAAVILAGGWLIDTPGSVMDSGSTEIGIHILSSVLAFAVLSVAAVYALFVALIDHFLRRHELNRLIRALPALEILEGLLFQLIAAGFVMLTISLGSGMIFINDMFAQHLAHKTILSIITWLIFGTLLWGRRFRGWRGRVAVRLTLAGVLLLLLSYFGTKLVLEVLLERSWQI